MMSRFRIPISWSELFKRTISETIADDVLSLAAQQAYYFFFALFPALLALISIASFFPIENIVPQLNDLLSRVAPQEVTDMIGKQIDKISNTNAGGLLTLAFVFTLWSSSNAVMSMSNTLNAAYDITESRPWWKVRLNALALTLGLALFIVTSMTLVIAGPALGERVAEALNIGPVLVTTWTIVQWPVVFTLVATAIAILYYFAPDAEQEWVWITPGSVLATVLWIAASVGVSVYVQNFGNYTETYGVIGGVMILMLWFYATGIAILVGAELNAEIEHASPYGKDVGERIPGEKKKIGAVAERAYEEKRRKGELAARAFPDDVNCDVEPAPSKRDEPGGLRPSEALLGAAVLLPAALKIAKTVKDKSEPNKQTAA
jgi:membrane protein